MMISLIYGAKGSGKTKRLIASANDEAAINKGCVVYLTDNSEHSLDIQKNIRYINIKEYGVCSVDGFVGFVNGLMAANSDTSKIFVEGINRFLVPPEKMEELTSQLEKISAYNSVHFCLEISAPELPPFLKRYI